MGFNCRNAGLGVADGVRLFHRNPHGSEPGGSVRIPSNDRHRTRGQGYISVLFCQQPRSCNKRWSGRRALRVAASERYHKQSVIATDAGNAAYWHPQDQQPVADNRNPRTVIKSKINGQATTSEPILENPDQHAEYVAPAVEPDDSRPIVPTISGEYRLAHTHLN